MPHSSTPSEIEATLRRVRQEVAKRKGSAEAEIPKNPPSPPAPKGKMTPLQNVSKAVERAKSKHEKARRWPKLLRPLRRNQEAIDQELIGSIGMVTEEVERLQKCVLPLGIQQAHWLPRQQALARQNRERTERVESLEETLSLVTQRLALKAAIPPENPETDAFYAALEDQFRGSRSLIKERLAAYLPHLRALQKKFAEAEALDVGCGRGEWLEILKENGIAARGVDLNAPMVEQCRACGLEAAQGDALAFLGELPDASLALVSGFHIIEHLPFPKLLQLFQESARVLRPGGIAIFETPNPEFPRVSSYTFHLDPTHRHPIPHELLSFIGTYAGFASVQIERLQPSFEEGVLLGYQDYAGVFTKI